MAAFLREAMESASKKAQEKVSKAAGGGTTTTSDNSKASSLTSGGGTITTSDNSKASLSTSQSKSESKDMKYHCFLTHNWGKRQSDGTYDNHERVRRIYNGLESMNVTCWFDSERMTGTINEQMSKGIDDSDCVIGIALLLLSLILS